MKHKILLSYTCCLIGLAASAAVPLRWTVETSRAQPAQFEAFQGETLTLEASLQSYGKPLELSGLASLYWQTNGMGSAYWEATASVNSNRLSAVFTPEMDVGAKVYNCFIGVPGTIYHAAFQLRLRPSPGALPNVLPLPTPVIDFAKVRVLNPPWESGGGGGVSTNAVIDIAREEIAAATNALRKVDGAAKMLPKYLWQKDFYDSYPDDAQEYYRSRGNGKTDGGCSAVRDGGFLYRNFDYPFDDRAEFVVRMSAGPGRFASVGVAQVGTNLTEQMVTSGKPSRCYKWLPGATVDGINENGVACNINVVDTPVTGWHTTGDLHPLAAVRWVLDNSTNAQSAAEYIAANIHFPQGWTQNFHWMVADAEQTWIVENGTATSGDEYHEPDEPVTMTNFQLSKFPWDGMGMERFGLLLGGANITNAWYTRAYHRSTNPPWVSDLREVLAYTNAIFDAWAAHPKEYFRNQLNGGQPWWQSVHTSVYDISNRTLRVAVQETDDWYTFAVPSGGAVKSVNGKTGEVVLDAADVGAMPDTFEETDPTATAKANAAIAAAGCVRTNEYGQIDLYGNHPGIRMDTSEYNGDSIYNLNYGLLYFPWGGGYGQDPSHDFATRADIPDVSGLVPYTGANGSVDIGVFGFQGKEFSATAGGAERGAFNVTYSDILVGGFNGDSFTDGTEYYYLPFSVFYDDADSDHKIPTVSQIEEASEFEDPVSNVVWKLEAEGGRFFFKPVRPINMED